MLPQFPFSRSQHVRSWSNYLGTISGKEIPLHVTPDVTDEIGGADRPSLLGRHGTALRATLGYAFEHGLNLRMRGSRWSASNVLEPSHIMLDLANLRGASLVNRNWVSESYRLGRLPTGHRPVLAMAGTRIAELHHRLEEVNLALQTSSSSNGQRVAGCIATGCHGSAIGVGGLHDTVLALHLMTGPNRCILLQPATNRALGGELAVWLGEQTGIPTEDVVDDDLFAAAQVALGSLGVVLGVVLEAVPLYRLKRRITALAGNDPKVWSAIQTMDTRPLHPDTDEQPHHFEVVLSPYPVRGRNGAFVQMYWKQPAEEVPPLLLGTDARMSSELMGLVGSLSFVVDEGFSGSILRTVLQEQLERRYPSQEVSGLLPGEAFGGGLLPEGHGITTEIAVCQQHASLAARTVLNVLGEQAGHGRHMLGGVLLRFAPESRSLLGMNRHSNTCFIEMPAVRNEEVVLIYRACWAALKKEGVPFTCHWGQVHELTSQRVKEYYGERVQRWVDARARLLPSVEARAVFATPLLDDVGLG